MKVIVVFLLIINSIIFCKSAKILAVFPAPFPSHQSVFRPLTLELARRGHEVVIITTDPVFNGEPPPNYKEIDVHDVSYEFRDSTPIRVTGSSDDIFDQADKFYDMFGKLIQVQTNNTEVKKIINDKTQRFDLLLIEACVRPALVFSHFFKVPVITISSLGSLEMFSEYVGAIFHPTIYGNSFHQKLKNMSFIEKAKEIYKHYYIKSMLERKEEKENVLLKNVFGDDVPSLNELKKNVAILMLNVHQAWEDNRPTPPNIIYLGGLHLQMNDTQIMSSDLEMYLDSSVNGVIYMSLGSLVIPSRLNNFKTVINALGKLPYDVLLKWDQDYLPECPQNIKYLKWVPQRKLLSHSKIKVFITQGGLQSTDEAIVAGVPLIGIPILGDQWYNVEKYMDLKIGLRVDLETVTEEQIVHAIYTVINDKSYKQNVITLRDSIYDRPESSLDRAVWWIEHVLRNGYSKHLQPPSAHITTWEYFEIDFIIVFMLTFSVLFSILVFVLYKLFRTINSYVCSLKFKSD